MKHRGRTVAVSLSLAFAGFFATAEIASACVGGADANGDGSISFPEFLVAVGGEDEVGGSCSIEELAIIFMTADADNSGLLSCDEFVAAIVLAADCGS